MPRSSAARPTIASASSVRPASTTSAPAPEGIPVQQDGFRWHIDLAKRLGKALQIHDRDAHADVLRILEEEGAPEHTVLHCFSGDLTMARECAERGYYLSFAGTVTFKNARDLRDALTAVPSTVCSSRPTRRTSRRPRTGVRRTPRSSCR